MPDTENSIPDISNPTVVGVDFAKKVACLAADNHCTDLVILDLRGLSPVTDFFVIGTGTSDRQMRSTIDDINDMARQIGQQRFGVHGYDTATWLLADYVDIVVHLFDDTRRHYYDLELLWGDAPRVEWESPSTSA